jgi:predicted alpha/beta-fold hydrolase
LSPQDVVAVLQHVHATYPKAAVFALAFSLGANLLVHALADAPQQLSFVAGAAAVGGPWDLLRSAAVLESGLSRLLYSGPLARGLVQYAQRNHEVRVLLVFLSLLILFAGHARVDGRPSAGRGGGGAVGGGI